jgi:hypothetical protein
MRLRKLRRVVNPMLTDFEFYAIVVMSVILIGLGLIALILQIHASIG